MCRLLLVQDTTPFAPARYLEPFAKACQASPEYQGHGWGFTSIAADSKQRDDYKNISPIWQDDFSHFGPATVLLAHARSAFRDEDIVLTNNMPFAADGWSFAFNGELRGVRVRAPGRTGAARIWNLIRRTHAATQLPMAEAVSRTMAMLEQRSAYIRAANILLTDGHQGILHTTFNESTEYFTLYQHKADNHDLVVTSSEPFDLTTVVDVGEEAAPTWRPIPNRSTLTW